MEAGNQDAHLQPTQLRVSIPSIWHSFPPSIREPSLTIMQFPNKKPDDSTIYERRVRMLYAQIVPSIEMFAFKAAECRIKKVNNSNNKSR